ncbi:MAG TPA: thioredoxin family protein [Bacteroidia bacterium]|jgi:peroxiredoxin|nr:thioredoxin family protein [Bacteroidia bacterium]HQF29195.1 thioredoxin family protein [Bacteroidia bacterium]
MRNYFLLLILAIAISAKGQTINDFQLLSTSGKNFKLSDNANAKGYIVVFTSNNCPFAKLYPERLKALNKKYEPLGIPLVCIRSTDTTVMDEDVYEKMIELTKREQFNFPYLVDGDQEVAAQFHADKTPHAFVIWKENEQWVVKYSGAIDDNGAEEKKVKHRYVAEAVDALLGGKEVAIKKTASVGCAIHYRKK